MRQFISDSIDQLDLALDQLAVMDRNFDRFALMLIDNIVELTLHSFIQDKASENEMYIRMNEPKHDPTIIERSLRRNFDNKVKGAYKLGLFDEEICETILNLHTFRNKTYHEGLRHESILHSISIFYFRCACKISTLYKPIMWSWSSQDKIPYRTRKYLDEIDFGNYEEACLKAYKRLDEVAASMDCNLVVDLANDMKSTIEHTNEMISFLADEGPEKKSRDEVIIDIQAWSFAFTDEAKEYAKENKIKVMSIKDYVEWISKNQNWPTKSDPIPAWKRRYVSLKNEKNEHRALKKYCNFIKQTENIRSLLDEAAMHLDMYIQEQVDRARGK